LIALTSAHLTCAICGSLGRDIGLVGSQISDRQFGMAHCDDCGFSWVVDPRTDFATIYSEDYYSGKGADGAVNYLFDASQPTRTAQADEWRGVLQCVSRLMPVTPATKWLDFGCGTGGLVAYLRARGYFNTIGFEQGWALSILDRLNVPHIGPDDVGASAGRYDVVTATEVIEHSVDPLRDLRVVRELLRPGGLLFVTTGNARPFRGRMTKWRYVNPDVHVSFFEPNTLGRAMTLTGYQPEFPGFGVGWPSIYRAKLHRSLRVRRRHAASDLLPWAAISRLLERRLQLAQQPVGWAI
jgi:SAM-dependent methyltransferase